MLVGWSEFVELDYGGVANGFENIVINHQAILNANFIKALVYTFNLKILSAMMEGDVEALGGAIRLGA